MEITYLGRSAFRLRGKEVTVVTDPYAAAGGPITGKMQPDIVTVSGPDDQPVPVAGTPREVRGPGEYEMADVLIHGVATGSEPGAGPTNIAYVFIIDDVVLCHLGRVKDRLTPEQIEEIGSIDVVFVPVTNGGSLGPTQAAEVVHQLDPKLVVPMELETKGGGAETPDLFLREIGATSATPEAKLSVTRGSLPAEVRVVVLDPRRG